MGKANAYDTEKDVFETVAQKTDSSLRWRVTCINRYGVVQWLDEEPTLKCPICLEFCNSKNSCMTVEKRVQEIQRAPNFFGGKRKYMPKPEQVHHPKTMASAKIDIDTIAKKRMELLARRSRA